MAEIGGQKVEAKRHRTVRRTTWAGGPLDGEAVERAVVDLDRGHLALVVGRRGVDKFDRLQLSSALMSLVDATTLFPQLPTGGWTLPLLFVFEGDPNGGPIPGQTQM